MKIIIEHDDSEEGFDRNEVVKQIDYIKPYIALEEIREYIRGLVKHDSDRLSKLDGVAVADEINERFWEIIQDNEIKLF